MINTDTETDAESSAASESEEEVEQEQQRVRKVGRKSIIKTPCRAVKRTNKIAKDNSSSDSEHPTDLVSACLDKAPLTRSVSCDSNSSEDPDNFEALSQEEQSKRILEFYKEKFKVRRVRPDNRLSATMYGRIMRPKSPSRRLRFIADSGTGVPILPKEIADELDIEIRPVDPDEPGCIGASGHDLNIIDNATSMSRLKA